MRTGMPRFQGENFKANLAMLTEFKGLADDNNCSPSQLALAWVLAQGQFLVPIPGTKHVTYLEENARAADLDISDADIHRAGEIINSDTVSGDRYAQSQMISLDPE